MGLNRDLNLKMMAIVANRLGELKEQVVFVGG